jgi:hypothetical protein
MDTRGHERLNKKLEELNQGNLNLDDLGDLSNLGFDKEKIGKGVQEITKLLKDENTLKAVQQMMKENPDVIKQARKMMTQLNPKIKKTKPNAPCPCDSGLKYKKCCFLKTENKSESELVSESETVEKSEPENKSEENKSESETNHGYSYFE